MLQEQQSFLVHFQLWIWQEKSIFHQGSCVFPDVILVSNYHSYKEKTIKLLPYHSFYGGHILPQEKLSPFFWHSASKNMKPPGYSFAFCCVSLKSFKIHLSWSFQHSTLNMCGYYFFFAEYKLIPSPYNFFIYFLEGKVHKDMNYD